MWRSCVLIAAFAIGASTSAYSADDDCKEYRRNSPAWRECMGYADPQPDPNPTDPGGENEAYVKSPGKCGAFTYYDKKMKKCMDARTKK